MKKEKIPFVIKWKAGGETKIDLTVQYNGNKANKQPNFQEGLKSKLGSIIARIGENKKFEFSVKTPYKKEVEGCCYYGEKLTVKISGDNPACAEMLKRQIEGSFESEVLADKVIETMGQAVETMSQAADTAIAATKKFVKESGKWPGAIVICIQRMVDKD